MHFDTGSLVEYAGSRWRVQRVLGVEAVLLRSDAGDEVSVDPLKVRLPEAVVAVEPSLRPVDELRYSDSDWTEARRRRDLLATLACKPSRTTADVAAAATSLGISTRRVWALLRRSHSQGNEIARFLPTHRGARKKRLNGGAEAIIQQAIDQHYAKRIRPSLQSLAGEVAGRCKAAGLAPPTVKTIKARVRARDQAWLVRRREGAGKARSLALLTGAHPGAAAPWERVQIDSTPCDIRLVREAERTVIGRPTITFAIDIYSRVILGFSVSLQSASTLTVATCLAHACLPKQDWLTQRDLTGVHWPVWGKPLVLEYDQGPEHEAKGIQRGLRLHDITSKVCAKGHPEHHGTIERLIGTKMRCIHERRGTTFSSVNELLLPDEQRIARIDRDRWIGYGRAREAIEELARILRSERRQRPDNLLIVRASNNGKTAIARRFIARMLPPENPDAHYSTIPVALIQAPNGPRIPQLLTSIRAALGQPAGHRESIAQLRAEAYRIMRGVGVDLPYAIQWRSNDFNELILSDWDCLEIGGAGAGTVFSCLISDRGWTRGLDFEAGGN